MQSADADAGVKPATVKHCLAVLSAIFTTAFNDQITMLNPCAGIKAPTVPPATRRIITPDQFEQAFDLMRRRKGIVGKIVLSHDT